MLKLKETFTPLLSFRSMAPHCHLALLFDSLEEQMAAVLPFIQEGLEQNEYCIYAATENSVEDILGLMKRFGIDTARHQSSGALAVLDTDQTYLRHPTFDPDEMIQFLEMVSQNAARAGFSGFRGTGEGKWALSTPDGLVKVFEYEQMLDNQINSGSLKAICQYNLNHFPPDAILNVLRTHPHVIYKGEIRENPHYSPSSRDEHDDTSREDLSRILKALIE